MELPAPLNRLHAVGRALGGDERICGKVRRCAFALAVGLAVAVASHNGARAGDIVAIYSAYWAGLPAAQIRLEISDAGADYRDAIEIRTDGLSQVLTHFKANATASGRLGSDGPAEPLRYEALYDLRKWRDSRIGISFVARDGASVAERSADDTSRKAPLAEKYRRNIVDPLTAYERIRAAVRAQNSAPNATFTVPVYDGTRRFDVLGRILPKDRRAPGELRVALTLRAIAGFKGETSEQGDPDDAPRPIALTLSDDARLLPISMTVPVFYLPLVVRLDHVCAAPEACGS
jgi:hypothetical protein